VQFDWTVAVVATLPTLVVSMLALRVILKLVSVIRELQAAILSLSKQPAAAALAMAIERSITNEASSENGNPNIVDRRSSMRPIA
jgi:hypothetical protein